MWIVRLALARPHTFLVLALVILVMGTVSVRTMPTDIFPKIDIPVVSVIWSYPGLSADEMESGSRPTLNFRSPRASTT